MGITVRTDRAKAYKYIAIALAVVGAFIFGVSVFFYHQYILGPISASAKDWADYGNFMGGFAGAAVSLLTLIALAINLHLQAKELQETAQALRDQAHIAGEQSSLSYFFELLRERREVITSFVAGGHGTIGRQGLFEDVTRLRMFAETRDVPDAVLGTHCWSWFVERLATVHPLIGVHIEMLRLIDWLNSVDTTRALAQRFSVTYSTTLTAPELGLLFYYGLTAPGQRELNRLLHEHAAFRNRDAEEITRFVASRHLNRYEPRAYARDAPWD